MRFFNIDFHVSVIADVRSLLGELGHSVVSRSLSNHTWVFGRDKDRVPGLDGMSTTAFGQRECDRFFELERRSLEGFDGFIVTHTPCLAGLYERTEKPVICVVSTRYDGFCHTPESRAWLEETLLKMHHNGQLILLANNAYDAWHVERHLGVCPEIISSHCNYTGAKWTGATDAPFVHGRKDIAGLRRLPPRHTWNDVASAACCVTVPYNASLMSMFERHTMGMPIVVPSPSWLLRNPDTMSELRYNQHPSSIELEAAARLSDWYSGELGGITFFDDEHHLGEILRSGVAPVFGVELRREKILESWRAVMRRIDSPRPRVEAGSLGVPGPASTGFWQWVDGYVGELRPDGILVQCRESHRELRFGTWRPTPTGMELHLSGYWRKRVDLVRPDWGCWRLDGSAAAGGTIRKLGSTMPVPRPGERRAKLCGDAFKAMVDDSTFLIHTDSVLEWHRHCAPGSAYTLITTYSDTSIDGRFESILGDENLRMWYSSNVGIRHHKLRPIPLGVCYRLALESPSLPGRLTVPAAYDRMLDEMSGCLKTKNFNVSFTVETNGSERCSCLRASGLPNRLLDRSSFLADLGCSRYCLSPEGIGTDCHRVWEALYCRTVPIITRNLMVDLGMYDGLPVVVLERWEDFHASDYTIERYELLMRGFDPACMGVDRWITPRIPSRSGSCCSTTGRTGCSPLPGTINQPHRAICGDSTLNETTPEE